VLVTPTRLDPQRADMQHTRVTTPRPLLCTEAVRRSKGAVSLEQQPERVVLAGFTQKGPERRGRSVLTEAEESLDELVQLAVSAGAQVQARLLQSRDSAVAATLIGSGKVQELADLVTASQADSVIFDCDLSPTQQRNLEKALGVKVLTRTQLILDIFASRARTREGRMQVELAQLRYLLPRLTGQGVALSRLGGGIGTRGPGETKLETDRRRIARRIKKIEQDIEGVRTGRALHRAKRQSVPLPLIAMAGYTNAGKSTLFNRLTGSEVVADARMFATLDPTIRILPLPSKRKALLSDTVGFIRNLPATLIQAFRATLEEVTEASLILHVVDCSSEHAREQATHVLEVLAEIGAGETPQLLVLNKADRLAPESRGDVSVLAQRILGHSHPRTPDGELEQPLRAALVSAKSGEGRESLLSLIDAALPFDTVRIERFLIPLAAGGAIALLHSSARVIREDYNESSCEIEAEVPESIRRRLDRYVVATDTIRN
jgi:GTP-binding protein HflX